MKIESSESDATEIPLLNLFGKEGWELVSVVLDTVNFDYSEPELAGQICGQYVFFFKRPID